MNTPSADNKPLQVRRGRVASVDLYEVKDNELDLLEEGSPATLQLNFAIFLLSLSFSSVIALCTATFMSDVVQTVFVVVAVIGVLMGLYLLVSWWRTRTSISAVVRAIRGRIEQQEIVENEDVATTITTSPPAENEPAG